MHFVWPFAFVFSFLKVFSAKRFHFQFTGGKTQSS